MQLQDYEAFVRDQWKRTRMGDDGLRQLFIMTVGLGGECGEVQEILKKHVRNNRLDVAKLREEMGDVLFYLTKIADEFGLTLAEIMAANREKLIARGLAHYAKDAPRA